MDRIILSRLAIYARHGVLAEEERLGQRFYISLTCVADLRPASRSDDYSKAICYASLADCIHRVATESRFKLIEALAEAIARKVLEAFPAVTSVIVKVEKPEAPIKHILDGVAIEIERSRDG